MIQLKVYSNPTKLEQFWLDLYETEPIKLTLSIEDITTADATSTYSKAFKVPGTRKNAEFFKNAFDVDGTLYDVTIKKPAEILVDGAEFKVGHIRLQRIFLNTQLDRYDYELLFLGETRDFSSRIGDKGLCQLDMPELVGNAIGGNIDVASITTSWQAYPENASLTAGLHNGNILYPLIDHGNTYNAAGNPNETRIALNDPTQDHFTRNTGSNPLTLARMKPMIRAKRIIDQIFADADYTYTSAFFESDLFHQIYISAFGNEASIAYEAAGDSTSSINCAYGEDLVSTQFANPSPITSAADLLSIPYNQIDPGNNLGNSYYTVPTAGGTYQFRGECYYIGFWEDNNNNQFPRNARLHLWNVTKNISLANGSLGWDVTLSVSATIPIQAGFFEQGDIVGLVAIPDGFIDNPNIVTNVEFEVVSAPGQYNPSVGLECSYKQIDFVKDILTAFRLVLAPDPAIPNNFIIEPWQTYINSGELYDWSNKLVESKDVVLEPVFNTQSETIKFDMQMGGDYVNIYHKQAYSENYGYLEFNSGNDLLKGTREIKLIGIAPTPISQIEGWVTGDNVALPQLHTHSPEDTGLQHLPLKVKTRMLFYNGLQPFTHPNNTGGANNTWYLQSSPNPVAKNNYPLVSPYQTWPIQTQTLNLNWYNDVQYWQTIAGYNETGSTMYGDYWSRYISSLYNKYSRRLTAKFVLNNIDLNTFSFDDTIFVNGTYFRPEKIIDVQVGAYTEVTVQLLTANDYSPPVVLNDPLTNFSAVGSNSGCSGSNGVITVTTDGTPPFTWTLSNGSTGSYTAPVGQAPYTFTISPVPAGTTTVTVTDALGRTANASVIIPSGTLPLPSATHTFTDPTNCTAPCNGIITVTPSGGTAPYVIYWVGEPLITSLSRTNLCAGSYKWYIEDANGCTSATYLQDLSCNQTNKVWLYGEDLNCNFMGLQTYLVDTGIANPNITDVVTLNNTSTGLDIPGCWRPISEQVGATPTHTVSQIWIDCLTCQGMPADDYWQIENCQSPGTFIIVKDNGSTPAIGSIWDLDGGPANTCWEVISQAASGAGWSGYSLVNSYVDCATCLPPVLGFYSFQDQGLGTNLSTCPLATFNYPMYSPGYSDPTLIPINSTIYSDPSFNNPWDGQGGGIKAKWYATNTNPFLGNTLASLRITANGTLIGKVICP